VCGETEEVSPETGVAGWLRFFMAMDRSAMMESEGILMCGRFTFILDDYHVLIVRYGLTKIPFEIVPRYNVAPSQLVAAIISDGEQNRIGQLKWGLVPSWAKAESFGYKTINAKAETVDTKPAFREAFKRRRCIIPADSFYEWRKEGNSKQPMRIVPQDGGLFSLAGLWDSWTAPDGRKVNSCTIITTIPNELMAGIHNRMPVILEREAETTWLDRSAQDGATLKELMRPYPAEELRAYPVSAKVGNVRNDGPELIEEVAI